MFGSGALAATISASYQSVGRVCHMLRVENLPARQLAMEYDRLYAALTDHFSNPSKLWDVAYPLFLHVYYELHYTDLQAATAFLESHLATVSSQPGHHHAARQLAALRDWVQTCGRAELLQLCQPPASAVAPIAVTIEEEAQLSRAFEAADSLELAWRAFRLVRPDDHQPAKPSAFASLSGGNFVPPPVSASTTTFTAASATISTSSMPVVSTQRRIDVELRAQPELAGLLDAADAVAMATTATTAPATSTAASSLPSVCRAGLRHLVGVGLSCCAVDLGADEALFAAGYEDSSIRLHFCSGGESDANGLSAFARLRLRGHSGIPHALAFASAASGCREPKFLISTGEDAKVLLWRLPPDSNGEALGDSFLRRRRRKRKRRRQWLSSMPEAGELDDSDEEEEDAEEEEIVLPLVSYLGHDYPVWCCDTHPYNASLFATGGHDRTAMLWCTDRLTPLRQFVGHLTDVDIVGFHPSGSLMYTAGLDSSVRLWDLNSGRCVRLFCARGWRGCVTAAAVSPSNGRLLAVGGEDRHVRVFDLAAGSGQPVWDARRHRDAVASLAWSPCGESLASVDLQSRVLFWPAGGPADLGDASRTGVIPYGENQLTGLATPHRLLWPEQLPLCLTQQHRQTPGRSHQERKSKMLHRPLLAVGLAEVEPGEAGVDLDNDQDGFLTEDNAPDSADVYGRVENGASYYATNGLGGTDQAGQDETDDSTNEDLTTEDDFDVDEQTGGFASNPVTGFEVDLEDEYTDDEDNDEDDYYNEAGENINDEFYPMS